MDNLSKNNLDDLFREGTQREEFSFRDDAWGNMEDLLDKQEKRRKLWLLWGLLISGLALVAIALLLNNKSTANSEFLIKQTPSAAKDTKHKLLYEKEVEVKEIQNPSLSTNKHKDTQINIARPNKTAVSTNKERTVISEKMTKPVTTASSIQNINSVQNINHNQGGFDPVNRQSHNELASVLTNEPPVSQDLYLLPFLENEVKLLSAEKLVLNKGNGLLSHDEPLENISQKPYFSLSVIASPELNAAASLTNLPKLGGRFGFNVDYHFAPQFSIGTGLTFSRRNYVTQGTNYTAKPGFWVNDLAPTEVRAKTNIVEIPLHLRWYTKGNRHDGLFVGLGVNSYLMSLEQYDFAYTETFADSILDWEERNTNQHYFGVGTFTVGWQKVLPSGAQLRVAPYYHLPLTGIGQGKMDMRSAGIQVEFSLWQGRR